MPVSMRIARAVPLGLVLLAGAIRVWAVLAATPVITPDTFAYARQSRLPLLSTAFWGSQHPPLLPLLWKPLPGLLASAAPVQIGDLSLALILNALVGAACFGYLALTVSRLARTEPGRWAVLTAVLALSLAPDVAGWDASGLSESISLSLVALVVALAIRYALAPGRRVAGGLALAVVAATLARDTNLPLCLLGLLPVLVAVRSHIRLLTAALVLAAALSLVGQQAGRRSETPTRNAIAAAIADPGAARWFRAHGMPVVPGTREMLVWRPAGSYPPGPDARALARWVRAHARTTWLEYLLSHPSRTLSIRTELGRIYDPPLRYLRPYWGVSGHGLFLHGPWLLLLAALGAAGAWVRRRDRETLVLLAFAAATLPLAVLIWDADALELDRHAIVIPVVAQLAALVGALLGGDAAYARLRNAAVSIPKYVGTS